MTTEGGVSTGEGVGTEDGVTTGGSVDTTRKKYNKFLLIFKKRKCISVD